MVDDWDDTVAALAGETPIPRPRQAYLIVVRGNNVGDTHAVLGPDMVIGRASGVDLRLSDEGVSRFHCRLRTEKDVTVIEDLGSRNGTFWNGERVVTGTRTLAEGDRLQIGTTSVLRFTYVEAEATPTPIPQDQGVHDALTGAFTRRYFIDRLEHEVSSSIHHKTPLSLVLIHIDRFVELCETRSQGFTDEITIGATNHIRNTVRKDDLVARIGVGELALMMRSTSPGDTFMQAERLRATGANLIIATEDGPQRLSFSIGVAAVGEIPAETAHDLLVAAGSALQRARSQGGNRVVLCTRDLLQEPKSRARV